jgi:Family of unknown function (DUF6125)
VTVLEINREELDELRLKAITAFDGLWFLAAERRLGFEKAIELDLEVWKEYGLVMPNRLGKILGIGLGHEGLPGLTMVNIFIETICRIDGTRCSGKLGDDNIIFTIDDCSWWENMSRSGREKSSRART